MDTSTDDGLLESLFTSLGAAGQLAVIFDGMVAVAPADIRPETVAVAESLKSIQQNLGEGAADPLKALGSNLVESAGSKIAFESVGAYLETNCPTDSEVARRYIGLDGQTSPATPSPSAPAAAPGDPLTAEAPSNGTTLLDVTGAGGYNVIVGPDGFSVINSRVDLSAGDESGDGKSTITTYDRAGRQLAVIIGADFTSKCGHADVSAGQGRRLVITQQVTRTAAEGIKAATISMTLDGWDALTGTKLWTLPLYTGIATETYEAGCEVDAGEGEPLEGFSFTADGKWGLHSPETNIGPTTVVDLSSGKARKSKKLLNPIGNYLVETQETEEFETPFNLVGSDKLAVTGTLKGVQWSSATSPIGRIFDASGTTGGSPYVSGSSADGEAFFVEFGSERSNNYKAKLAQYALPSLKENWLVGDSGGYGLLAAVEGVLLVAEDEGMVARNADDGKTLWQLPTAAICGVTDAQLMVSVNDQLAILDPRTGEQLSSDATQSECPGLRDYGVAVTTKSIAPGEPHGVTVTQVLQP